MVRLGVEEMEREENRKKEAKEMSKEGKTLVVGIRANTKSRELLSWALVNVAVSGDRIVAVHVTRFSSSSAEDSDPYVAQLQPIRSAFEGFCSVRKIDLVLKVCRGFSVRRAMVRQAKLYSATHLILGEAKSSTAIRSSLTSIPKYCAKRVPPDCSVIAVNNGRIVFGTGEGDVERRQARNYGRLSNLLLDLRKSIAVDPFDCFFITKGQEGLISDDNISSTSSNDTVSNHAAIDALPETKCSFKVMVDEPEAKSDSAAITVSTVSLENQELSTEEVIQPTDSLRRRSIISHRRTSTTEGSINSLVQWTKWIHGGSSASSTSYSILKHRRSETYAASNLRNDFNSYRFDLVSDLRMKLESLQEKYSFLCKLFSYKELVQATCNFSPDRLIGRGGSSQVYKGTFPDGKEVAVKILRASNDALKEFILEIDIITTVNHKNVISLKGFCFEESNLMLIYEFLSNGSLEENLHGSEEWVFKLKWLDRYRIAMGVAEALNYLHGGEGAEAVIHMDVKSSNILLSEDFEPKLSDFGLATRSTTSVSHMSCKNLAGTFGYLAPECFMFGQISKKTDVYAFGVVLLELITGRKPIDTGASKGDQSLVMWAKPMLQSGKALELVDPILDCEYDGDQLERMLLAASLCLKKDSRSRPSIDFVLKLLSGDEDAFKWANLQAEDLESTLAWEDEAVY